MNNEYRHTEYISRSCPVCMATMSFMSDGTLSLAKCLNCGYSKRPTGTISDAHFYDRPVLASFLEKKGYYELYTPLDEGLYNALYSRGWDKKEIIYQVIQDLRLTGEALDYFLRKVEQVL